MKKILLALVAVCSLALASCSKESSYTVDYYDNLSSYSNLTVFEYSIGNNLLYKREIKNIQNGVYEFVSTAGADFVVFGCESIVNGKIMEWYSADYFMLDSDKTTNIEVDYVNMRTQDTNPVDENDAISHYLSK